MPQNDIGIQFTRFLRARNPDIAIIRTSSGSLCPVRTGVVPYGVRRLFYLIKIEIKFLSEGAQMEMKILVVFECQRCRAINQQPGSLDVVIHFIQPKS